MARALTLASARLRASAAAARDSAAAWWNEPAFCPDDDEWERVRMQAQRLDNCMAGVAAVLAAGAICLLLVPTIVGLVTATPG